MKSIKKTLLYCGLSREEYEDITPLIAERNHSFTSIISLAMVVYGALIFAFQVISGATILFPYLFLVCSGLLLYLTGRYILNKPGKYTLPFCYLHLIVIFIFAIILSSQASNRGSPSTSIIVFLAVLPLTINDRPIRMFSVVAFFSLVYLFCSFRFKAPGVRQADVMNTVTFSIMGMAVYLLISNRNVHEIYLRKVAAESERLREEKRIADMANAAKSEFLANMSHEIRTPINAILGMNEIVLRESRSGMEGGHGDPKDAAEAFGRIWGDAGVIDGAGHNLLSIVNDILDFSKIEAGRMELAEGRYDLSSVLNDVSSMVAFRARDNGLEYRLKVDETLPSRLYGDEVRVRQVITNLLSNAVKYTKQGSVELSVGREEAEPPENGQVITLVISVADTGVGIREEDLDKLFSRFERIDLQKNGTIEGTGLGLAITRKLLDMMGGSIYVESVYGEGSTFTVRLPQKVVSAEPLGNFQERYEKTMLQEKAYRESFHAPEGRILVVDDTRMNLKVVVGLLEHTRLQIDTAESGAEAIEMCGNERYDVILMDQRMPHMDGTEAMRRIREQPGALNADTPFICLTADAVIGARERYLSEGFTDYLTKPINGAALERMLMKYLPSQKVSIFRAAPKPGPDRAGAAGCALPESYEPLRAAGISPEVGLDFCQNDPAFYESILREFSQSSGEKIQNLNQTFGAQDWKNYGIYVHALNSSSRFIGASELSETAAKLEAAALAGDGAAIRAGHDDLMASYESVLKAIRATIDCESDIVADDDVMEFEPNE